jgi:hypothetical protein
MLASHCSKFNVKLNHILFDGSMYVHRLVSVVKIATMLKEYTTEEQHSVVFCGQKDSVQRAFIKKCFLFIVGSVCHVKQFTIGLKNSLMDVLKTADDA